VVVPRSVRRLERLLHAFGPFSAAAFDIMGLSAYDSCLEEGPFASALFDAERFLRRLFAELSTRGLSYRVTGNDSAAHALAASRFGFVVSAVGLESVLWETLTDVASRGTELYFGGALPSTTPNGLERLSTAPQAARAMLKTVSEAQLASELSTLAERHAAFRLDAGDGIKSSLYRDAAGRGRVLFVTNTTREARVARVEIAPLSANGTDGTDAVDALDGAPFRATFGALEVPLSPYSVRMLELT
jgi:beta-galactosidase